MGAIKQIVQAVGIEEYTETTTLEFEDMADMSVTLTTGKSKLLIFFHAPVYLPSAPGTPVEGYTRIVIDDVPVYTYIVYYGPYEESRDVSLHFATSVSAGRHTVKMQWRAAELNNLSSDMTYRTLQVIEITGV